MKRFLIGMAAVMTGAAADVSADGPKGNGGGASRGPGVSNIGGAGKFTGKPTTTPFKPTPGGGFPNNHNWNGNVPGGNKPPVITHSGGKDFGKVYAANKTYHLNYGKPFKGGFCYPGKYHDHWSYRCYSPKYGCDCYWCPSTCCYYYWCEPACCYYPISYISYAPPYAVAAQSQVQVQVQVQSQAQTQGVVPTSLPGGPPPGVPPLPE